MIGLEWDKDIITLSYIDESGGIKLENFIIDEIDKYEWVYDKRRTSKTPPISWDEKPLRKNYTNRRLSKYRIQEILLSLPENDKDRIFQFNYPKKFYCDIETEIVDGFPDADNPKEAVLTICIVSEKGNSIVLSIGDSEGNHPSDKDILRMQSYTREYFQDFKDINPQVKYVKYDSEYDMLTDFFYKYMPKIPLLTGWNFLDFDYRFLTNRARLLNIDYEVASPTGNSIWGDKNNVPYHRHVVDYLEIYKKWEHSIIQKDSNKLDWVANEVLGVKKIEYPGTLKELYLKDYNKFINYNIVDTILVKLLDDRLSTLNTYLLLSWLGDTESRKAFKPVPMIENILLKEFMKEDIHFVNTKIDNKKDKKYDGAYVHFTEPGLYEALAIFDFASLYPSIMRQWNISPETFLGFHKGDFEDLKNTSKNITAIKTIFDDSSDSIMRRILTSLYEDRSKEKHLAKEVKGEIEYLENILKNR